MKMPHAVFLCVVVAMIIGCGPPPSSGSRGGSRGHDGGNPSGDAGDGPVQDAGNAQNQDTGTPPPPDAGPPPRRDTGPPPRDTGPPPPRDTGPPPCAWPTRNLGNEIGQSLPSSLAWQGLGPRETRERSISIDEFFDCDGSKGIHAVLIVTSQYGCSRCTSQAAGMTQILADWRQDGLNIQVLTLKIEDPGDRNPASMTAVNHWRDAYNLTTSYVGYDNGYTMVPRSGGGRFGTPLNSIVDPHNMEVVAIIQGYDRSYAALLNLARRRAGR